MLFSTSNICLVAVLLGNSSLAGPIAIAFGNISFNGITFGTPFNLDWYGGDGTPVTIILNSGNPAALQPLGSVATNLLSSPFSWTPVASQVVKPGVPYVLSIQQSGLTNYSPFFTIAAPASAHGSFQAARAYGAPLPVGAVGYYPLPGPENLDAFDSGLANTGSILPRNDATGGILPRHDATGLILSRNDATGSILVPRDATRVVIPRNDATGVILPRTYGTDPSYPGPFATSYPTGTASGSSVSYPTGGPYNNVSASGTGKAGAGYDPLAPISGANSAHVMGMVLGGVVTLVSAGCISLLL